MPQGHGNAYGHDKQAGTALARQSVSLVGTNGILTDIGPGETGTLIARIQNPNQSLDLTLTNVVPSSGAVITNTADSSCTADASTVTITPWSGSQLVAHAGGFVSWHEIGVDHPHTVLWNDP